MAKRAISQLTKLFDHKCGISQRIASKKFKCSQSLISKTLKTKTSMKKRKQMKIPSRTESQRAKNRRLCGQLYKNYKRFKKVCVVLTNVFKELVFIRYCSLFYDHIYKYSRYPLRTCVWFFR